MFVDDDPQGATSCLKLTWIRSENGILQFNWPHTAYPCNRPYREYKRCSGLVGVRSLDKADYIMGLSLSVRRFWRGFRFWIWTLEDAFPPYHKVEGPLENKETNSDDKHFLYVGSARVEVDEATFNSLVVGENLRVRYTRGNRAINIDRLMPGAGPG